MFDAEDEEDGDEQEGESGKKAIAKKPARKISAKLTGVGRIISEMQNAGIEVRHEENLREHYGRTCAAWCENLVANWEECVAEVGEATAKVWGVYLAGSRMGFEQDQI